MNPAHACPRIDRRAVFTYALNEHINKRGVMPRVAVDDHKRINLRVRSEQKATFLRAAALRNTDLTDCMLQPALRAAKKVIAEAECLALSERDSLMVLKLLEKPPAPNARLRKALASYRRRNERPGLARGADREASRRQGV